MRSVVCTVGCVCQVRSVVCTVGCVCQVRPVVATVGCVCQVRSAVSTVVDWATGSRTAPSWRRCSRSRRQTLVARIISRQGRPTGSDSHDTETAVSSSDTVSCCYPGRHIVWDVTVPLN